jgi:hypothetical protein
MTKALPRHHSMQHPLHPGTFTAQARQDSTSNLKPNGGQATTTNRGRLSARFLRDFHNHWATYGRQAIHRFYTDDPAGYCRLAGSLIPKHIDVRSGGLDEFKRMSSDEIRALMREAVRDALTEQGTTIDGEHEYIVDEQLTLLCGPIAAEARGADPGPAHGDAEAAAPRGIDPGDAGD